MRYTPPPQMPLELGHPSMPDALWVAGDQSLLFERTPRVCVIGARNVTQLGILRATRLTRELTQMGVIIVSGLAQGVDVTAHETCISSGGRTIAVIGTPIDRCYPAAHARIQMEIAAHHLLVSQFHPGSRTYPSHFVKRNRTMAFIGDATVIVEASDSSGTLSQAAETMRMGKPLFIMRSLLDRPDLAWPHRFVAAGAIPLESIDQVLSAVGYARH